MRTSLLLTLAAITALSLAACNGKGGKPGEGETIKIGQYASMTGKEATFGTQVDNGVRLAMDEINAAGGVLGKKIEVITEDTRSLSPDAINAVEKLIGRDHVVA